MNSQNKKILLLKTGQIFFATQGFTKVGLAEILKQAKVPKCSFYYYFNSKEDYGVQVIQYYVDNYVKNLRSLLDMTEVTGKKRLLIYWKKWQDTQCSNNYCGACLTVKLSSEVTDYSEPMRHAFCFGTDRILNLIAAIISAGQNDQSIANTSDPFLLAQQLYQQWLGASLMVKIQKQSEPFQLAFQYTNFIVDSKI